jgi:hypothetical protein
MAWIAVPSYMNMLPETLLDLLKQAKNDAQFREILRGISVSDELVDDARLRALKSEMDWQNQ